MRPCWNPPIGIKDAHKIQGGIRIALNTDGTLISRPRIVDQQRLTADPVFRAYAEEHNVNTTSCKAGLLQSPNRARALDLPAQRSVSATTPGHPGLAPVAAPICAAIPEENTMTIKSSRKKSGSRAAKATNRKNSKATAAKPPGTTKLALLVAHLSAPGGATIAELCKATGWQPHSVRGALAGALRRKGHVIGSAKEAGLRRYRIEQPVT